MNDKEFTVVSGADLAIGIQFQTEVGAKRHLTLTTGVPLDWTTEEVADTLTKLADAAQSLADRYLLEGLREFLERCERDLNTLEFQRNQYEINARAQWANQGRRGEWKPQGTQEKEIGNFDNSRQHLVKEIKRIREDIERLEKAA